MRRPLEPAALAVVPVFAGVDFSTAGDALRTNARLTLRRDQVLFRQGDRCTGFYYVQTGRIRLAVASRLGTATTVEIIAARETFGEAVVFLEQPFYPVTAIALMESELFFISAAMVDAMLAADPRTARRLLANLSLRNHRLVADVAALSLESATGRVCEYLLRLCPEPHVPGERVTIALEDTKKVVANRLSLTPESFSRALRRLAERGLVVVHGSTLIIDDPTALAAELAAFGSPGIS